MISGATMPGRQHGETGDGYKQDNQSVSRQEYFAVGNGTQPRAEVNN